MFRLFVSRIDFAGKSVLEAMRLLFDCFKPGGEGQVIDRIMKYFGESYFAQNGRGSGGAPDSTTAASTKDKVGVSVDVAG